MIGIDIYQGVPMTPCSLEHFTTCYCRVDPAVSSPTLPGNATLAIPFLSLGGITPLGASNYQPRRNQIQNIAGPRIVYSPYGEFVVCDGVYGRGIIKICLPEDPLSLHAIGKFTMANITFSSIFQALVFLQAVLIGDLGLAHDILGSSSSFEHVQILKEIPVLPLEWAEVRHSFLARCIGCKLRKDSDMRQALFNTNNSELSYRLPETFNIWGRTNIPCHFDGKIYTDLLEEIRENEWAFNIVHRPVM